jgi:hypothetical protein
MEIFAYYGLDMQGNYKMSLSDLGMIYLYEYSNFSPFKTIQYEI